MPERGTLDISKAKKLIGYKPMNQLKQDILNIFYLIKNFGLTLREINLKSNG